MTLIILINRNSILIGLLVPNIKDKIDKLLNLSKIRSKYTNPFKEINLPALSHKFGLTQLNLNPELILVPVDKIVALVKRIIGL